MSGAGCCAVTVTMLAMHCDRGWMEKQDAGSLLPTGSTGCSKASSQGALEPKVVLSIHRVSPGISVALRSWEHAPEGAVDDERAGLDLQLHHSHRVAMCGADKVHAHHVLLRARGAAGVKEERGQAQITSAQEGGWVAGCAAPLEGGVRGR